MSFLNFGPIASYLGRGKASITIPTMDGAFRTNELLENADLYVAQQDADCLAIADDHLFLSAGHQVFELTDKAKVEIATYDSEITALAANGTAIAVGLAAGGVEIKGGSYEGQYLSDVRCPTAILFQKDQLIVAEGAEHLAPSDWARDLLERGNSGKIVSVDLKTGQTKKLANGAAWASGLAETRDGKVIVSQSWRHCLSNVDDLNEEKSLCHNLPGYPSRISPASDGGYWLAIFGMRTQLIEFILREKQFRKQMLKTVPTEYWVAPALVSRENFLDPMQQGAVKQLGIKKPWAPPRSYGLVVKLDEDFQPQYSLHSRVGGLRHGVTSAVEKDGMLYVVARGAGQVIALNLSAIEGDIVQ